MPIAINCPACHHAYHLHDSLAGKTLRCKICGAAIAAPSHQGTVAATTPPPSAAPPLTPPLLAYASASSPQFRKRARAAVWCSISAALWIIAAALRGLLNSNCGIGSTAASIPLAAFIALFIGDLLIIAGSILLVAAAKGIRQGDPAAVKRALSIIGGHEALYGASLLPIALFRNTGENTIFPLVALAILGLIPFLFSIVAFSLLFSLRRQPPNLEADLTVSSPTPAQIRTGRGYLQFAVVHVLATVVLLYFASGSPARILSSLFPLVFATGFYFSGRGIQRGEPAYRSFALVLLLAEVLAFPTIMFFPIAILGVGAAIYFVIKSLRSPA